MGSGVLSKPEGVGLIEVGLDPGLIRHQVHRGPQIEAEARAVLGPQRGLVQR
jgi:hypothetical protein